MTEALYTLVAGEGDGAMLGLAAGDTAGGAWELGYSAITEQAVVIAYELIANGAIDRARLIQGLLELDGSRDEEPVYRSESPEFRAWLDRAAAGSPNADETPSLDPLGRSVPLGLTFRKDSDALVRGVIALNTIFHADAGSVLAAVALTSAVAASCFGQVGRDLLLGVAESIEPAARRLESDSVGLVGMELIADYEDRIRALTHYYGVGDGAEAVRVVTNSDSPGPLDLALAGLLLVARPADTPHEPIAEAVKIGGGSLGAAVGGIMGARVGIRAWPWAFANDTWFAEIGRRLVRGPSETRDLPIPYAVEQHLISGVRQDRS